MAQNSLLDLQEMKPTPRNQLLGLLSDVLTAGRDFADKAKVPAVVPLLGGQGLGSLLLGKAPEELTNISYGNMPLRINPLAGRTASFVPEIKPGRKESLADLVMAAQAVPGGNRAALGALGAVDTGANKAAIVWHGSPHKFDKFDASKIGTGEGAQAYGHGLYLAESPDVARSYKDTLRGLKTDTRAVVEKLLPERRFTTKERAEIYKAAMDEQTPVQDAARRLGYRQASIRDVDQGVLQRAIAEVREQGQGSLYKVDLPDPLIARMLDWDKPLSQQAPEVREAVSSIKANLTGPFSRDMTGDQFLMHIQSTLKGVGRGSEKAEGVLRQQGIPGIRYLDGGSRNVGAGTSNFVVFPGEEQFLRILERNGGLLAP